MCPQLVDFDGDGRMDLVAGTFEGTVFVVRGSTEGYLPFERVTDTQGRNVQLSQFWNNETEAWDEADRSPTGRTNPADHCISAVAVDWDDDGDLDLLLGAKEGRMYLQRNEGTRTKPAYTGINEPLLIAVAAADAALTQANVGAVIEVPGGLTAPRLVDWNGDGLFDLVCGSFDGGVFAYLNRGVRGAPAFSTPIVLLPNARDRRTDGGPTRGTYADAVDWDGDGDLDLLVGGYVHVVPKQRVLSPEEAAKADALEIELAAAEAAFQKYIENMEYGPDGHASEEANAEVSRLWREVDTVQRKLEKLRPQPAERGRVFLYERL